MSDALWTFVQVAVGPSLLPDQGGPQELPGNPGPLSEHETHFTQLSRNPAGHEPGGQTGMCGHVLTVGMLWWQVRVGAGVHMESR